MSRKDTNAEIVAFSEVFSTQELERPVYFIDVGTEVDVLYASSEKSLFYVKYNFGESEPIYGWVVAQNVSLNR